jgi:hypothetical protein
VQDALCSVVTSVTKNCVLGLHRAVNEGHRVITYCNNLCLIDHSCYVLQCFFVLTDNIVLFKEPIYSLTVTSNNFRKENQCIIEYKIKVNQILVKPAITDRQPCP